MDDMVAAVGMRVRYPRTGTTGKITRLEKLKGGVFAEIDTTRLLYRVDQLVTADVAQVRKKAGLSDNIEQVKKEREYLSDSGFSEAVMHSDQSCEGGG
jgi:Uncharacterized protein conserved in archaea